MPGSRFETFPPSDSSRVTRRDWLRGLAVFGLAGDLAFEAEGASPVSTPDADLLAKDPDRYWAQLRTDQFLLADDRVFLNPGSLGVMPRVVLNRVMETLTRGAEYSSDDVVRWGYERLESERGTMAAFLGCRTEELAFTHNCTEAMSIIANGLDHLRPGDEILTTNQEHGGGSACWRLRAARTGVSVREIEIPTTPKSPEELLDRLLSEIKPRTRVLSFSGITSPTGLHLPVRQLCQAAREKDVISVVDGAHMDGQVHVDLQDLGCDYFAGSPHKWMFAPPGCGLLYGRGDRLDQLWPCVVNAGWDDKTGAHAARFMMIGTNNRCTIDGMMEGLRFLQRLGPDQVYRRIHHLARLALAEVHRRPYLEAVTPDDDRLFHAMISFRFRRDPGETLGKAMKAANINAIVGTRTRLSTHIHCRPSDIEAFFRVCDEVVTA
ncbi:MAG: aminotransferase class V-fold PLP-dependent enzyme [Verrucomicrobiales bacterium]|nr:aminotransferase class V-fold PLP-dependent enzyme [Verrucomicrobiales bacterium]